MYRPIKETFGAEDFKNIDLEQKIIAIAPEQIKVGIVDKQFDASLNSFLVASKKDTSRMVERRSRAAFLQHYLSGINESNMHFVSAQNKDITCWGFSPDFYIGTILFNHEKNRALVSLAYSYIISTHYLKRNGLGEWAIDRKREGLRIIIN